MVISVMTFKRSIPLAAVLLMLARLAFANLTDRLFFHSEGTIKALDGHLSEPHNSMAYNGEHRQLQSSSRSDWRPINIKVDFSNIQNSNSTSLDYIQNILFAKSIDRIRQMVSVSGPAFIAAFNSTDCDALVPVPQIYSQNQTEADLIILVGKLAPNSSFVAQSSSCRYSASDRRTIVGVIQINPESFVPSIDQFAELTYSFVHEILHLLAFSPSLYSRYPAGFGNILKNVKNSNNTSIFGEKLKIISPSVVSFGKKYFNCSDFDGIMLEDNQGDAVAPSHFEKLLLGNELMTSQKTGRGVVSLFTLHFLNDLGWYQVDYNKADPISWGFQRGCAFLNNTCSSDALEVCQTERKVSCSADLRAKTRCQFSLYAVNCLINEFVDNFNCDFGYKFISTAQDEYFGANGRCLNVAYKGNSTAGCYRVSCPAENTLSISLGGEVFNCTNSTTTITKGDLTIKCPTPESVCKTLQPGCPSDCSGSGRCLISGKCMCDYFHEGEDCSLMKTCDSNTSVCYSMAMQIQSTKKSKFGWRPVAFGIASLVISLFISMP